MQNLSALRPIRQAPSVSFEDEEASILNECLAEGSGSLDPAGRYVPAAHSIPISVVEIDDSVSSLSRETKLYLDQKIGYIEGQLKIIQGVLLGEYEKHQKLGIEGFQEYKKQIVQGLAIESRLDGLESFGDSMAILSQFSEEQNQRIQSLARDILILETSIDTIRRALDLVPEGQSYDMRDLLQIRERDLRSKRAVSASITRKKNTFLQQYKTDVFNFNKEKIDREVSRVDQLLSTKKHSLLGLIQASSGAKTAEIAQAEAAEKLMVINLKGQESIRRYNLNTFEYFQALTLEHNLLENSIEEEKNHYEKENHVNYTNDFSPPSLLIEIPFTEKEKSVFLSDLKRKIPHKISSISQKFIDQREEKKDGRTHYLKLTNDEYESIKSIFSSNRDLQKFMLTKDNCFPLRIDYGKKDVDPRLKHILDTRPNKQECLTAYGTGAVGITGLGVGLMFIPGVGWALGGAILLGAGLSAGSNILQQGGSSSRRFSHKAVGKEACVSFLLPSVDLMETLQVPTDLTDSTTTLLVYTKYITLPTSTTPGTKTR
ncbi:hypothetical protein CL648_02385 [bacterium]|nr:hypothetical protein [bacterium]